MNWQPIETAPKDRPIVCWCSSHKEDERFMMCYWSSTCWRIYIDGGMAEPTHWYDVPPLKEDNTTTIRSPLVAAYADWANKLAAHGVDSSPARTAMRAFHNELNESKHEDWMMWCDVPPPTGKTDTSKSTYPFVELPHTVGGAATINVRHVLIAYPNNMNTTNVKLSDGTILVCGIPYNEVKRLLSHD